MALELLLFLVAAILIFSILASKLSVRIGVPALLLFILLGMLSGSEGIGGIYFDDPLLTQSIGVIALIFILFSGGLDTQWQAIRPVMKEGLLLATVGVAVTALLMAWFAQTFLGFSWLQGILLGATMASTDAAAVFSVLRGKSVNLKNKLKPILELESGSNDPMAIFLTIAVIQLLTQGDASVIGLVALFIWQMAIGLGMGWLLSRLALWVINQIDLEYDGLYPVLSISFVLLTYGATTLIGANGFLAVYVAGLVFSRNDFIHKNSLCNFHDGLAWLMQIVMFLTLGLQVFPSNLLEIAGIGFLLAFFLIFLARPLSVFLALIPSKLSWQEKVFISWVGLRGAAPIVLATFSLIAAIEVPFPIFDLVFFVVLTSVLLQGISLINVAKWLGLLADEATAPSLLRYIRSGNTINEDLQELTIPQGASVVGKRILDLNLPTGTLIVLLNRNAEMLIPNGNTHFEALDTVLFLSPKGMRDKMTELFTEREGL